MSSPRHGAQRHRLGRRRHAGRPPSMTFAHPGHRGNYRADDRWPSSSAAPSAWWRGKRVAMTDMPQMIAHLQRHGRRRGGGHRRRRVAQAASRRAGAQPAFAVVLGGASAR
ncbi:MAG: hypothetical protein MZV65_28415 [Chromatiales bacterium]|nr:hypothetical protein [Chromatiales bacterium]